MLFESPYRLDFTPTSSAVATRLIDFGQLIDGEIELGVTGKSDEQTAMGALQATQYGRSGLSVSSQVKVVRDHSSHGVMRNACHIISVTTPVCKRGTFTLVIDGGATWQFDGIIQSAVPVPYLDRYEIQSMTRYDLKHGLSRPITTIDVFPGIPIPWLFQPITSLTQPITSL